LGNPLQKTINTYEIVQKLFHKISLV